MALRAAPSIRVMLVEDHPVVRRGLRDLLGEYHDLRVVGEAATVREAVAMARALQPDVITLPIRLGDRLGGVELCRALKTVCPARTIVYTAFTTPDDIQAAALAGADGLVSKLVDDVELVECVRAAMAGQRTWVVADGDSARADLVSRLPAERLTGREREILDLILRRCTNPQIAAALTIEVSTVKTHVRNIMRKLGVESRKTLFTTAHTDVR